MSDLKTTYKDDLLDTSVNEKRKYNMIQNSDGTVSFEDVTTYSQIGDSFGAADINATNKKVNEVNSNLNGFSFDTVNDQAGYYKDGQFYPFDSGELELIWTNSSPSQSLPSGTIPVDLSDATAILVYFEYVLAGSYTIYSNPYSCIMKDGASHMCLGIYQGTMTPQYRIFTVTDSGISHECGRNDAMIPSKIWKIKALE